MQDVVPLQMLTCGQQAEIEQLCGPADHVHRLEELGLRRGVKVEMVQAGSPCMIRLGGSTFGLRGSDLLRVLVRVGASR